MGLYERLCRITAVMALLSISVSVMGQDAMRIHYSDGTKQDIFTSQIDSITFTDKAVPAETVSLTGSWLWGKIDSGYYELLTFNNDHTYTGYDNYFTYGFDTMTYGWYSIHGTMLTLTSNGFGYQRIYNWFFVGLSSNALDVMTKMGQFTYYKLQPEVIHISPTAYYNGFSDSDTIVFADGNVVKGDGNKIQAITPGTTYVLVKRGSDETIVAYKVIVE